MSTKPLAIIVEDDGEVRQDLTKQFKKARWEARAVATADSAKRLVRAVDHLDQPLNDPRVVIVDLDLGKTSGPSSYDFLQYVAERFPNCKSIVFSGHLDDPTYRDQVLNHAPAAICVPKEKGVEWLRDLCQNRLFHFMLGDLVLSGPSVIHQPTGFVFIHRVAFAMVQNAENGQPSYFFGADKRAVGRFKALLEQQGSFVTVRSYSDNVWTLIDSNAPDVPLRRQIPPSNAAASPAEGKPKGNFMLGDLVLSGPCVIHQPTGFVFTHRVAVAMVQNAEDGQPSSFFGADTRAVGRFKALLEQQGSFVTVRSYGHNLWTLIDSNAPDVPLRRQIPPSNAAASPAEGKPKRNRAAAS